MIFRRIKKEFELAGVWRAMRKNIPASQYTRSGDPLKIDCGYGVNSTIKMFHATPLRSEINAAKALAFTFPQFVEGLRQAEGAQAQLTAIVEDGLQRENEAIVFAMEVLQGLRVLVVDDEPDARDLLSTILRRYGSDVRCSESAADAMEAFAEWEPDILVSDIGLPNEDGYSLIKKVRQLDSSRAQKIPAVALTAYATDEDRIRALDAGFQTHVAKPIEPELFVSSITSVLKSAEELASEPHTPN